MKKFSIVLLCINLLLLAFTGCNRLEKSNILDFGAGDIENIEVYHFNIPTEAKGMVVTESEDFKRIMNAFSAIKIEREARLEDETCGGEVTSFRFNLKDGKEFVVAYWEGILRNPDDINYKVSADSLKTLWSKINYTKNRVSSSDLPVINKQSKSNGNLDYNKIFELNLFSDKQVYKTTDKIKIWATLKYIGSEDQIKIWHSNPYIGFTITDGKDFNIGGLFDDILTSTILIKDKLYNFDFKKSGGWSADDPKADYWNKFFQEKDLYLPEGEYTVKAGGAFSIDPDPKKGNSNLIKELKIKVESGKDTSSD